MTTSYSMTPSSTSVDEDAGTITFTVTRSGDKPAETVYVSTVQGASNGYDVNNSDYTGILNQALSFSSGQTSRTVAVSIRNDSISEGDEKFAIIVQRNATDAASTFLDRSTFTIRANDQPTQTSYSLSPSSTSITEGGQITFTITRSGDKPVETVYFSTLGDGTATYTSGDYATTSGGAPSNIAVAFSSGQTSRSVVLDIRQDGISDSGEQFRAIVQRNSSDPASSYLDRSSYVTINDVKNTDGTTYSLTPSSTRISEGQTVNFVITRSGDRPAETIYVSTVQGSSNGLSGNNSDYDGLLNKPVIFQAGANSAEFSISTRNDSAPEIDEQFGVIIQRNSSDPVSKYLDSSRFTIEANDQPTTMTSYVLTAPVASIQEGERVVFTVSRSGTLNAETIYFSTLADGGASYHEGDYTLPSGAEPKNVPLFFGASQSVATVTLDIKVDASNDSEEQFRAIVQKNVTDASSSFLSRSNFITIRDNNYTVDAGSANNAATHAVTSTNLSPVELHYSALYLPYAKGVVADVTQRPGGDTSHTAGTTITAVDFALPAGAEVRAMADGRIHYVHVAQADYVGGGHTIRGDGLTPIDPRYDLGPGKLGNFITIEHYVDVGGQPQTFYATYAHLDADTARLWQKDDRDVFVPSGTILGHVGATGAIMGYHLHVQIGRGVSPTADGRGEVADGRIGGADLMSELRFVEGIGWPDTHSEAVAIGDIASQNDVRSTSTTKTYGATSPAEVTDVFVAQGAEDTRNGISIFADGVDALISAGRGATNYVLRAYEEIRLIGSALIDSVRVGPLVGTTISDRTVYFDGGADNDLLDARLADRRIVAEGGDGDDRLFGGTVGDGLNGGSGDDRLDGGLGDDLFDGGAGADTADFSREGRGVVVDLGLVGAQDTGVGRDSFVDVENVRGGVFNDALTGSVLANLIFAGEGDDLAWGGGGDDLVFLKNGADEAFGGDGRDYLEGGGGADRMFGGLGDDRLEGDYQGPDVDNGPEGNDALFGDEGDDFVRGNGGDDLLSGGSGNDRLDGGAGNDRFEGGDGVDTADFTGAGRGVVVDLGRAGPQDTGMGLDSFLDVEDVLGSGFGDALTGSGGANLIHAGEGDDLAWGGGGDDQVFLKNGRDEAFGGDGRDYLEGGGGDDRVFGGLGDDRLEGDYQGPWFDNGPEGNDALFGDEGDDHVRGNGGDDALSGGSGNDRLEGGSGNDRLDGGEGSDTAVYADAGRGVVVDLGRGGRQDTLGAGSDELVGIENVEGSRFGDALTGSGGANVIYAGEGDDIAWGGEGDDSLFLKNGTDRAFGDGGRDYVEGGGGADTLYGGAGDDWLEGDYQGAWFDNGPGGADTLFGDEGNDVLRGGAGGDRMTGGDGADRFLFWELGDSGSGGMDRITDFNGFVDRMDLSRIDADVFAGGDQAFRFVGAFSGQAGQATLSYDGARNVSTLRLDVNGDRVADFALEMDGAHSTELGWVM